MFRLFKRLALGFADRVRYHPAVRGLLARLKLWRDALTWPRDSQSRAHSVVRLCAAARLAGSDRLMKKIERRLRARTAGLVPAQVRWDGLVPGIRRPDLGKAVLLKPWVSHREKGVVFVSFEDQWMKLLPHVDLQEFARRYTLVVSPTWSPPHSVVNVLFPQAYPEPFFSLISNSRDLELFPRLSDKYRMIPLYASSWVNPDYYKPMPHDCRDLDIVMIANFGPYKRHYALFRALRQMPGHIRATLIGQSHDGRTADTIRREAWAFGVEDRVTVLSSVSNETLADCLGRAKVSVILSRREGSCVAVAESLFADTPVVLLRGAEIGSAAFINDCTGVFVAESRLAQGLMEVLERHRTFAPRCWAEVNISCHQSSRILNRALRRAALDGGQAWTWDIAPLCWRPDPQLVEPAAATWLPEEWHWAHANLGVALGPAPTSLPSLSTERTAVTVEP
jgi:hypothetical protein